MNNNIKETLPQVAIWDCETRRVVAELNFSSDVRRVRLTRDRIVVALDTMVKVFSFTRPPQQTAVYETGNNPNGLLALSPTYQNVVLAYPARDNGKISILDLASSDNEPKEIKAHNVRLT